MKYKAIITKLFDTLCEEIHDSTCIISLFLYFMYIGSSGDLSFYKDIQLEQRKHLLSYDNWQLGKRNQITM